MMRLFKQPAGDNTKLSTKLRYYTDDTVKNSLRDFSSKTNFQPCYSTTEFENVFQKVEREIAVMHSLTGASFSIEIKLNGKLGGKAITQKFNDVASYRLFLENNGLIQPSKEFGKKSAFIS